MMNLHEAAQDSKRAEKNNTWTQRCKFIDGMRVTEPGLDDIGSISAFVFAPGVNFANLPSDM